MVINCKSSSWGNVISGVPQGSVIGLVLFFYINDIDIDLCLKLCKFADDIKIGHAVATEHGADLKNLANWAIDWK